MASYFLLVSYDEPRGRRFVRLAAPTVLAWFQQAWRRAPEGRDHWSSELRGEVYGLGSLFDNIVEHSLEVPADDAALDSLLEKHLYYEDGFEAEPHFVHVETNDDEGSVEYFFFDDEFLQEPDAHDRLPDPMRPDEDDEVNDKYVRWYRKQREQMS